MTNYFLGNQLLCFKIKSYNIFFMATRLQQIFVHAQISHISADIRIRTFLRRNREQSFLFFAIKVQCAVIASAQFFVCCCFRVWYLFDQCYPACALCVICFVRGLQFCALCNAHRRAAIMREPLALLASTLPISQSCSDFAKQGCNYFCLFFRILNRILHTICFYIFSNATQSQPHSAGTTLYGFRIIEASTKTLFHFCWICSFLNLP